MHELAVCESLLREAEKIARTHGARAVSRLRLAIGPLAGIESALLEQAFSIARAGTVAAEAALDIDWLPLRVRCRSCGAESTATPNRLICGQCGDWHTELMSGDEMLLTSLELVLETEHV
ncbi:MAG: hydrogenase maturation nickel metallochaperone HypA [Gammaproteobacteria bacterium]|nr:hydrogenase maturation nickel metallochaperone HypA [Gammaproteobacteria bacterium]